MIFRQLFDRESSTYTYLLAEGRGGDALLIDPVQGMLDHYVGLLDQLDLKLVVAVDTHVHADHITALGDLRDRLQCASMMGAQTQAQCVSATFREGEVIRAGKVALKALYTPGHTDDSYSFLLQDPDADRVFTGDTLLIRGTGRTDFQNGDARQQYDSLFNKLLALPEDTLVYPGHDYKGWTVSSIWEEKRYNPRLQVANAEEYAELMANLNLPNPKMMDVAVPANRACGKPAAA